MAKQGSYYVPEYSTLPFLMALSLFCVGYGTIHLLQDSLTGKLFFMLGAILLAAVLFIWFQAVIKENQAGLYDEQVERSFRWGMIWFIFTEIFLFGILFFALFYARFVIVPSLGGNYGTPASEMTHLLLWPNFKSIWPVLSHPNIHAFENIQGTFNIWGIPALNTLILLMSSATITWAHWGLRAERRYQLILGVILTILLGLTFLILQWSELIRIGNLGLQLSSGIYASTFFMLTGFHAAHVIVGLMMLMVILFRVLRSHFSPDDHFGFEAGTWYWNFVDGIWLVIFILVYWL